MCESYYFWENNLKNMKKIILSLFVVTALAFQSCNEAKVDPAATEAKVNELAAPKIEAATAKATEECETRMATEVKPMADSLVNAAKAANAPQ